MGVSAAPHQGCFRGCALPSILCWCAIQLWRHRITGHAVAKVWTWDGGCQPEYIHRKHQLQHFGLAFVERRESGHAIGLHICTASAPVQLQAQRGCGRSIQVAVQLNEREDSLCKNGVEGYHQCCTCIDTVSLALVVLSIVHRYSLSTIW